MYLFGSCLDPISPITVIMIDSFNKSHSNIKEVEKGNGMTAVLVHIAQCRP